MEQKRASEAGLTLLELVLALSIGTVLITSFFVSYRALMQAISLTSNELNATSRVAEMFASIVQDLEQADNSPINVPADGLSVTFMVGGFQHRYDLVFTPGASQDAYVQKTVNGVTSTLGPRHALANLHPFPGTLKDYNSGLYGGYNPVPLFTLLTSPGTSPQVVLHGVIQTNQDAPVRYVQTRSTPRFIP